MKVSGELLFNGALVAGIAALIYSRNIYLNSPLRATPVTEYTSLVAPDVFVRPSYFSIVKGDKTATSTFLVRHGGDHILIDAGSPGREEHAFDLTAAVGKIVGNGSLPLLLLTHGHIDHVGAIPDLVEAFPELQVVFHSLEAPFITGGLNYNEAASKEMSYQLLFAYMSFNVSSYLPPSRVLLLHGSKGDLSTAKGPNGEAPKWSIPKGLVTYQLANGHAPGQTVYIHQPSGSAFVGDAVEQMMEDSDGKPMLHVCAPVFSANITQSITAARSLVDAEFTRIFPVHDAVGSGATKEDVVRMAERMQEEGWEEKFRLNFQ